MITPPVERLRDSLGLPGMLVLQFGFDPDDPDCAAPLEHHVEQRVVYTGTHDHDTVRGWYESLDPARRRVGRGRARAAAGSASAEPWWALIRLAFSSPARVAMVQAQDVLGLGSDGADEPAGLRGRVALAARAGRADARAGAAAAGGHRGGGAAAVLTFPGYGLKRQDSVDFALR